VWPLDGARGLLGYRNFKILHLSPSSGDKWKLVISIQLRRRFDILLKNVIKSDKFTLSKRKAYTE